MASVEFHERYTEVWLRYYAHTYHRVCMPGRVSRSYHFYRVRGDRRSGRVTPGVFANRNGS